MGARIEIARAEDLELLDRGIHELPVLDNEDRPILMAVTGQHRRLMERAVPSHKSRREIEDFLWQQLDIYDRVARIVKDDRILLAKMVDVARRNGMIAISQPQLATGS